MSTGLFSLALVVAAPGAAGLQKGDELTFSGTVVESVDRTGQRLRREHALTVRILVLERQESWYDAAVLTRLERRDDAVTGATRPVTGVAPDRNSPPRVQLELVRIHTDGSVHLVLPAGPRLRLATDTPAQAVPPIPLDTFAASELGVFPPRTPRSAGPGEPWTIASGGNRPDEVWVENKPEFLNGEQCRPLVMNQQSPDWAKPVGGQTSWHRADAVWVSTEDGTARKVHRVILQRDGRGSVPAAWVETKYELTNHEKLSGQNYNRARRDVEAGYSALADVALLGRDASRSGARGCADAIAKLDVYLSETEPGTPYREAIVAAKRILESARQGNVTPGLLAPTNGPLGTTRPQWPEPGQLVPNVPIGNLQLAGLRGKPVVLVFFKPASETTDLSLAIAAALDRRYGGRAVVLPLAVFGDVAAAVKDRDRLQLAIPIQDGSSAAATFGVDTFPRFLLVDAQGRVVWTFRGVGAETGGLLKVEVDRLTRPGSPIAPSGTTASSGTSTAPTSPHP